MVICPLISDSNKILACHPACALNIEGECALRILAANMNEAKSKSKEQINQDMEQGAQ